MKKVLVLNDDEVITLIKYLSAGGSYFEQLEDMGEEYTSNHEVEIITRIKKKLNKEESD